MTANATTRPSVRSNRLRALVVGLCSAAIIADGYDLIVYGTVVPSLLSKSEWALTPPEAGRIGSYALIGMLVGALVVGTVTDIVGRRRIMMICVTWFSLAMGLCALAPSPELFGACRFIAGLGLGGVVPTAIALTVEYAPRGRESMTNGIMFSGYSVGGIIAALVAIPVIPALGWRAMFWFGVLPALVLVPVMYRYLPESVAFLSARGRHEEAAALSRRYGLPLDGAETGPAEPADRPRRDVLGSVRLLFAEHVLLATVLFWVTTAIGLLLVYGLNTWLAEIMRTAGYPLGPALAFLLVLNLGAIVATPLAGLAADRLGSKPVVATMFLASATCIALLSVKLPTAALYALVAVAGAGSIGTTIVLNAWTARHYPAASRATALGWTLAVGRLGAIMGPVYGGLILDSGLGLDANFYAFAIPALAGAVLVLLVPRPVAARDRTLDLRSMETASRS